MYDISIFNAINKHKDFVKKLKLIQSVVDVDMDGVGSKYSKPAKENATKPSFCGSTRSMVLESHDLHVVQSVKVLGFLRVFWRVGEILSSRVKSLIPVSCSGSNRCCDFRVEDVQRLGCRDALHRLQLMHNPRRIHAVRRGSGTRLDDNVAH